MSVLSEFIPQQSAVVDKFLAAIAQGRLHHAYVLVGRHGAQNESFAQALVKTLVCETPVVEGSGYAGCGACNACRKVDSNHHANVIRLGRDEKGVIRIAPVREISKRLTVHATEDSYRVVWISHADAMNTAAQNALLKTLEEPPERTVFIMTVERYRALLPTVRSRSQRVALASVDTSLCQKALEGEEIEAEFAQRLAWLAGGDEEKAKGWLQEGAQDLWLALQALEQDPSVNQVLKLAAKYGSSTQRRDLAIGILLMHAREQFLNAKTNYLVPERRAQLAALTELTTAIRAFTEQRAYNPNLVLTLERLFLKTLDVARLAA